MALWGYPKHHSKETRETQRGCSMFKNLQCQNGFRDPITNAKSKKEIKKKIILRMWAGNQRQYSWRVHSSHVIDPGAVHTTPRALHVLPSTRPGVNPEHRQV